MYLIIVWLCVNIFQKIDAISLKEIEQFPPKTSLVAGTTGSRESQSDWLRKTSLERIHAVNKPGIGQ
jgi:hypothetical protein